MGVFRAIEDYIRGISNSARQSPSLEDFLSNLIPILTEALESDAASIFLADRAQDTLSLAATTGIVGNSDPALIYYRFGEGLTGQIAQNRLPLSRDFSEHGADWQDRHMDFVNGKPTLFLGAPLLWFDNQVFGVVRCLYTRSYIEGQKTELLQTLNIITSLITPYVVAVRSDEERFNSIERITHELKSSLVAIKNTTLMVENDEKALSSDSRLRLDDVVSFCDMLLISIDSKSLATRKPISIETSLSDFYGDILLPVLRMLEPIFRRRSLSFNIRNEVKNAPRFFTDRQLLRLVVFNLFDNALKYASPNSSISIGADVNLQWITITFSNTGIGIEENEVEHIFSLGYRASNASRTTTVGQGYGLYICRFVMRQLKGDVLLTNRVNPTTFALKIPMSFNRSRPDDTYHR